LGKRAYRKQIASFKERIREHEQKIRHERSLPNPNARKIKHWQVEIATFRNEIKKAEKRLKRAQR